jgi:hypothetical protein
MFAALDYYPEAFMKRSLFFATFAALTFAATLQTFAEESTDSISGTETSGMNSDTAAAVSLGSTALADPERLVGSVTEIHKGKNEIKVRESLSGDEKNIVVDPQILPALRLGTVVETVPQEQNPSGTEKIKILNE